MDKLTERREEDKGNREREEARKWERRMKGLRGERDKKKTRKREKEN